MKKIIWIIIVFFGMMISSCSTLDEMDIYPRVSNLFLSDCYHLRDEDYGFETDAEQSRGMWGRPSYLEMITDNGVAKCVIREWVDNCIPGKVSIKTHRSDSVVTLVMDVMYGDGDLMTTCLCNYDLYFTIENLPEQDFILEIFRVRGDNSYKNRKPDFRERVELKDSTHRWECRL